MKCASCGAPIAFDAGTESLRCAHCGTESRVDETAERVVEEDLAGRLEALAGQAEQEDRVVVRCASCAAETTLPEGTTAASCPFCGTAVVAAATSARRVRPQAVLPFRVAAKDALAAFRDWVRRRWFAPSDLRAWARDPRTLTGVYVPYWTFDAATTTEYAGMRGDHYTVEVGSGRSRRRETRTRWRPAAGTVAIAFDDVLVPAARSLPPKLVEKLEPWDLPALVPYADDYLAGFLAESYRIGLPEAFEEAKGTMSAGIRAAVHRDIGGDTQRILALETRWEGLTFKHVLLPVWTCAYRYRDRVYRFLVNARTGEVQGERPWSAVKIVLAVLAGAAIAAAIWGASLM